MTPETLLANEIALFCGEHNWIIIREQSGLFYTQYGEPIRIGFPGLSDYLIITDKGDIIFLETKIKPRKPTQDQVNFINEMNKRGITAFVCYTLDEFKNKVCQFL